MPLQIIGKKSWNPRKPENIERVARDKAAVEAKQKDNDRITEEYQTACRLASLRGEEPPPPPELENPNEAWRSLPRQGNLSIQPHKDRKRRRERDEDETDYAIRVARLDQADAEAPREISSSQRDPKRRKPNDAPLIDSTGHINLFPDADPANKPSSHHNATNIDDRKERARKDRELARLAAADPMNPSNRKASEEIRRYEASVAAEAIKAAEREDARKREAANEDPFLAALMADVYKAEEAQRRRRAERRARGEPSQSPERFYKETVEDLRGQWEDGRREDDGRRVERKGTEKRRHRHSHSAHRDRDRDDEEDRHNRHRQRHSNREHRRAGESPGRSRC
ncbi:hypothetical protein K402DRAFT_425600 [Aulographum hederae CBS 113979]|uniref:CBF1-interacting co-repressor CIR N-terminal domain-containing protein n=1 Tax=Aulographum hederae CBS 113979 TaxID=1176131 RepID=A0A6G1GKE3_9PEZI|nr:hypothetical protein K402DRAFT_425600 [Aulographum hederae CBS 113979]